MSSPQGAKGNIASLVRKSIATSGLAVFFLSIWAVSAAALELGQEVLPQDATDIWPVLLPLLAASASVERAIEFGWNYIEWFLLRFLRWSPTDLRTPAYTEFKSGTSLLAGVVLGILVVNYSNMRLLAFLQPTIPEFIGVIPQEWDVLITGILVGAGSKPAHDVLGIITQIKNFTANSAIRQREEAGAALSEGILRLSQADNSYSVDVPGIGPAAVPGGSAATARSRMVEDRGPRGKGGSLDSYAKTLHDNLYINS